MVFKVGDPRPANAGRKKGSQNKSTLIKQRIKTDPAVELEKILKDPKTPLDTKVKILTEFLKYFYPQLKAMSVEFDNPLDVNTNLKVNKSDIEQAVKDVHELIG